MDRKKFEAMTPEERLAVAGAIERVIAISNRRTGTATLRFSVGNTLAEFVGWFLKNMPLRENSEQLARELSQQFGLEEAHGIKTLRDLRESYAKSYADAAMRHFLRHLPDVLSDALELLFYISLSEAVDQLQGEKLQGPYGVTLNFPRANRAKLRKDVQKLVNSQVKKRFPGKQGGAREPKGKERWTAQEQQIFAAIAQEVWPVAKQLRKFETSTDLRADADFKASPDEVRAIALRLLEIRKRARSADRTPVRMACWFAAEQVGRTAYSPGYLEKLFERVRRADRSK